MNSGGHLGWLRERGEGQAEVRPGEPVRSFQRMALTTVR